MHIDKFLVILILFLVYMFFFTESENENLTNTSDLTNQIHSYIMNTDGTFADYINFLTSIKNTNLNIIDYDVFSSFKSLKKHNLLTINEINDILNV